MQVVQRFRARLLDAVPGFLKDCAFYVFVFALNYTIDEDGGSSLAVAKVFGIYTLAYAILAPVLGRLSDRKGGRVSVYLGAILFTTIAVVLAWQIRISGPADALEIKVRSGLVDVSTLAYSAIAGFAVANGLYWPALQAAIGDRVPDASERSKVISAFNLSWTTGKATGFLVSGLLFAYQPQACFYVGAVLGALVLVCLVLGKDPEPRAGVNPPANLENVGAGFTPARLSLAEKRPFLLAGLFANLVLWGCVATLKGLTPKLGKTLGVEAEKMGALMFAALAAQAIGFWILADSSRWTYRRRSLLLAVPVAIFGLGLVTVAGRVEATQALPILIAGVGAIAIGGAQAVAYAASVTYSLDYDERRGLRTGVHEAMLALGGGLPLLGGLLADHTGFLQAPLLLMLGIAVLGGAVVGWLLRRPPGRLPA